MSDFTPINSQEEFDEAIKGRIARERENSAKKYAGYISPDDFNSKVGEYEKTIGGLNDAISKANEQIKNHENEIADRDLKIKAYESHSVKTRIAHEFGLDYDAVDFLQGDDEDSIKKSAESLKNLVGKRHVAPLASGDDTGDTKKAALKNTLKGLKGE